MPSFGKKNSGQLLICNCIHHDYFLSARVKHTVPRTADALSLYITIVQPFLMPEMLMEHFLSHEMIRGKKSTLKSGATARENANEVGLRL